MKQFRYALVFLLVFVFSAACSHTKSGTMTASNLDRIVQSGILRVGTTANMPPLNMLSKSGVPMGLDVDLARLLARAPEPCRILHADPGPDPDIAMLETEDRPPWSGGGAAYAIPAVLDQIRRHRTTLIFHNTRAQAEIFFHELWLANDEDLPIGIHHGSLARASRERVEAAMAGLTPVDPEATIEAWGRVKLVDEDVRVRFEGFGWAVHVPSLEPC